MINRKTNQRTSSFTTTVGVGKPVTGASLKKASSQVETSESPDINVERLVMAARSGKHTLPRGLTPEEILEHIMSN